MRNSRNGFNVVLSRGRRSNKKITIAVLVLLLTFSIGLAIKSKIVKTPTSNQLIPNTKMNMVEKGANDKDDKVSIEWNKTYGGPYWDTSYCVAQTCDGGYILVGSISHGFFGPSDVWLIKTDASGDMVWNRTYGGNDTSEVGMWVEQTTDGGYIILGQTDFDIGILDVWLLKTDEYGNLLWNKTFGGKYFDNCYCVRQTTDGGYVMAGYTMSFGLAIQNVWLIKTDENGNEEWNQIFAGASSDCGWFVEQTAGGEYIITGESFNNETGYDIWLIKTDENGNEEWNQILGGTDDDYGYCVRQTADRGYIIVGRTDSYGAGNGDVWLIKVSSDDKNGIFDSDLIFYSIIGVFIGAIALFAIFLSRRRKYELEEV